MSLGNSSDADDLDQDLREMNLWMAKPLTFAIPWLQFTPTEIQFLLRIHFQRMGYMTKPLSSDPVVLDCHDSHGGSITLHVCFPKDDLALQARRLRMLDRQFGKLSSNRRVIVLLEDTPEKNADTAEIEIWNRSQLELELCKSWLTQQLLVDNSSAVTELLRIACLLINEGEKGKKRAHLRAIRLHDSPELKEILWSLKDRTVTLQKNCMLLQYLCENTDLRKMHDRELFESTLALLSTYGTRPILDLFRSNDELILLAKEVYKRTYGRSNWFQLAGFVPDLRPKRLEKRVVDYDFASPLPDSVDELGQEWHIDIWRVLSIVTGALEATIDDMYHVWLEQPSRVRKIPRIRGTSKLQVTSLPDLVPEPSVVRSRMDQMKTPSSEVFIIHGRDENSTLQLKTIIQEFGLHPIVLEEEPARGRTIIEKIEQQRPAYAFVLLTPDDDGKPRPNVVLEYGWFASKLGRDHICCLMKGKVDLPSDLHGINFLNFEENVEEIRDRISDELKAVGFKVVKRS